MFTVYVLYSDLHNKIYIGFTSNLEARLPSHNAEKGKGYTHRFKPWKLIHIELFTTKAEALKREKQLKSTNDREFVWNRIESSANSRIHIRKPTPPRYLMFQSSYLKSWHIS